jgi:MFS transporter, DHA1 family, tetracycline resistance protein
MIRTLVLLVALCNIAFMTFNTVIGPIGRVVGMPEWQIGFMMSVSGICWMMSSRPWGRHSDGVGRYRVMQQGLIGFTVLFALLSIAVALGLAKVIDATVMFFSLLFTRGALGAFYAALPVASQAMIADSLAPEKRAGGLAALGAASGVGMILGPAIGGVLGAYSLILPLLFATVLSAAAVLLVYRAGTSLKAVELEHRSGPRSSPPMSLTDRRLRWPMAVALCAMFCVISALRSVRLD